MSRSKLFAAVLALPLMIAGASSAQANVIALDIDGSTSISAANFLLQKQGYHNALTDLLNTDGSNSIGVWQFATTVSAPVFVITKIDSVAKKNALIAAIDAMTQMTGLTAIGDAITTARNAINTFVATPANCGVTCGSKIIDVSTDGDNTTGSNPTTAANNAWTMSGIKVNCLGVGAAHCTFNDAAGVGTDFLASGFDKFEAAIRSKLSFELTKTPEPMTLTLFGAGLAGVAAMRRRKIKKA